MTTDTKYLTFKGIEKKEQILFKSFLNLIKNDLDYQIVLLKDGAQSADEPSIVIKDKDYEFEAGEDSLQQLPTIFVSDDVNDEGRGVIVRPVQWSDFKKALSELTIDGVAAVEVADVEIADTEISDIEIDTVTVSTVEVSADEKSKDRVLPTAIEFAIDDDDDVSEEVTPDDDAEDLKYEYELDKMSIDYHSITNSDYMDVVNDVKQFKDGEDDVVAVEDEPVAEPQILMTDDESASSNSVLVIETNSMDAWDFSMSEMSENESDDRVAQAAKLESFAKSQNQAAASAAAPSKKAGFDLTPNEKYWLEDNEIIADEVSVLFIKAQRAMVYSADEPAKWPEALQGKALSKLPLRDDWRPKKGLHAYPVSRLAWVNSLVHETEALADGLSDSEKYMLERWPHFDLLELDNTLLKLCTMMFVRAESLESLVKKSGYGRSTVRGLMNACYQEGILRRADQIQVEKLSASNSDDGVFGKIKDVFR